MKHLRENHAAIFILLMHLLNAWHEVPIYSARERAALAWTEAVTNISDGHVQDEVYDGGAPPFF